jgi:EmrB/QacA subfamily drug resistance transporter
MTMNVLDQTIVNVALPTIQRSLGFSQASLAWVIDSYLIAFGGLLLLAGRLGDLIGRKRTFLAGVTVFTVSSILCGIATTQGALIGARFAQGAGAAFSASVTLAIVVAEFPKPGERARAMNVYILVTVAGGSLGLLLGGVLTQALSWHWIFFINVPIGLITLLAGAWLLDSDRGIGIHQGLDVWGALVSTVGLLLAIYAIVTSTRYGFGSAHTLGLGAGAVALLAAFAWLETRVSKPMMPVDLLRAPGLTPTILVRFLMTFGMYGVFFLGALLLQKVHGYDAVHTGLGFLAQTLSVAFMTLVITARLMRVMKPKLTAITGLIVLIAGLTLFAVAGPHTGYFPVLFLSFLFTGAGSAMAFTPLLTIGTAEIPAADAGLGSGLINVTQQVGAAIAVALLSVVAANRTNSMLSRHHPEVQSLADGYRLAFVVSAACVAGAVLLGALLVRNPRVTEPADLAPVVAAVEA